MENILQENRLGHLIDVFEENMVGPEEVLLLSDEQFVHLGVTAIGIMARLRHRCRAFVNGNTGQDSPVIQKLKENVSKKQRQPIKKPKTTRRFHVGWKHAGQGTNYVQVTLTKGGGTNIIDICKDKTLADLKTELINLFFPKGLATLKKLQRDSCNFFIASFTGQQIDASDLTVGEYLSNITNSPVRVYLHSFMKDDDEELPHITFGRNQIATTQTQRPVASGSTLNQPPVASGSTLNQSPVASESTLNQPPVASGSTLNQPPVASGSTLNQPPVASGSTLNQPPVASGSTLNQPPVASGSTLNQSPVASGSTLNQPPVASGSTLIQSPVASGSTLIQSPVASGSREEERDTSTHEPSLNHESTATSSDMELLHNSGTPTVTFHPRNRLSLSHRVQTQRENHNTETSYITLFDQDVLCVSDDSEIEEQTDLEDNSPCGKNMPTLTEVLVTLRSNLDPETTSRFNINRSDVIDGARRAIKRKSFSPMNKMSVKFTDDCGNSEGAVDEGGPTRELLRILMQKIQQLPIFEGPSNARLLALNAGALTDDLYRDAGTLISMSLVHGGPASNFFSKLLYDTLSRPGNATKATIEDVSDVDMRSDIKKLMDATGKQQIQSALDTLAPLLSISGCYRPVGNVTQKDTLVQDLINFLVLGRTREALFEFAEGLQTLNVLKTMRENPVLMKELFVPLEEYKLTATILEAAFYDVKYEPEGSNKRRAEDRIVGYWRDFLLDIEEEDDGDISLKDILVFGTGADVVPPLGFDPLPSLAFSHAPTDLFPTANTCALMITLPTSNNYETFKTNMIFGIANSPGFGMA